MVNTVRNVSVWTVDVHRTGMSDAEEHDFSAAEQLEKNTIFEPDEISRRRNN